MLVKSKAGVARTRRRMLLFSLPVVLLALFIAWKLISMPVLAGRAIDAYDREQFEQSAESSDALMFLNVVEDWIPYFNRGTAFAAGESYSQATDDLAKALERAPEDRRCDVRVNLALAWELQGDAYFAAGYFAGAASLYETAKAVIDAGAEEGCFEQQPPPEEEQPPPPEEEQPDEGEQQQPPTDGQNPDDQQQPPQDGQEPPDEQTNPQQPDGTEGTEEKLEQADQRLTEKLRESGLQREQQQDDDGDPSTPEEEEEEPGDGGKVDELRDKGDEAEQERQNQDSNQRGQDNSPDYVEKPW